MGYGFLFANFNGNGAPLEKLSLYYSPDGKYVLAGGNNNPVYMPAKGVRDPSTIFFNDTFYTAYTINNGYDKNFGIAKSTNGIDWSTHCVVDVSSVPDLQQAWAPEIIIDDDGAPIIFFSRINSSNIGNIWFVRGDASLANWSPPQQLGFYSDPAFAIDATFIKKDGLWYCFYSKWGVTERAVAPSLTGTYTIDRTGDWAGWGAGVEGPCIIKTDTGWRIYQDRFSSGKGMSYSESTDFENWTPLADVNASQLPNGWSLRHGTVLPITDQYMYDRVMAAMLPQRPKHAEFSGSLSNMSPDKVYSVGSPNFVSSASTCATFVARDPNGYGKFNFFEDGLYAIGTTHRITAGSGVTRTFAEIVDVASGVICARFSGGDEDVWSGMTILNITTPQQLQVRWYQMSSGNVNLDITVRITKIK